MPVSGLTGTYITACTCRRRRPTSRRRLVMSWDTAARAKFLLVGLSCRNPTSVNGWYVPNTRGRNDVIDLLAVE
eukprot:5227807-Prymnesium_polylepis.1